MSEPREDIFDSIADVVGRTPMVRLSRIGRDLPCELLGKCEFLNPGGSIKDRIGVRMVRDAEAAGRIEPGDTLIEPTSGNTGIGMAMTAAAHGYRLVITMPEKMSQEKQVVLEALGAEIIRTPTDAAWDSAESHIGVAKQLQTIIPHSHMLDQYNNPSNPLAHEEGTGREIIDQCGGRLDAVVLGAGTGGTVTGVARIIKREVPDCQIVGVDPEGSILAGPEEIKTYKVEGIGYDFIPGVLDRDLVDRWIKCNDRDSFRVARQLIRQEGLLVGGSSGSAVWAAMQVCRELGPGKRVVVILPDNIRNYLTKFVSDAWMRQHGFLQAGWEIGTIGELVRAQPKRAIISVSVNDTLGSTLDKLKEHCISQMPVLDSEGRLEGIVTETDVLHRMVGGHASTKSTVAEIMERRVSTVAMHESSSELTRIFDRDEVALVVDEDRRVQAIFTKLDLIDILARGASQSSA